MNTLAATLSDGVTVARRNVIKVRRVPQTLSQVTQASRELFGNVPVIAGEPTAWSLQHPVAYTLLWTILIIAIFAPLSIRRFSRS